MFGIPDEDMGEQIKAVIEPLPGVAGDEALRASIVEHIQERLGEVQVAAHASTSSTSCPREPTGKLLKRKLRDPYWEGRDRAI